MRWIGCALLLFAALGTSMSGASWPTEPYQAATTGEALDLYRDGNVSRAVKGVLAANGTALSFTKDADLWMRAAPGDVAARRLTVALLVLDVIWVAASLLNQRRAQSQVTTHANTKKGKAPNRANLRLFR